MVNKAAAAAPAAFSVLCSLSYWDLGAQGTLTRASSLLSPTLTCPFETLFLGTHRRWPCTCRGCGPPAGGWSGTSCSPVTRHRHRAGYQETVSAGTFRSLRELLGDSPAMASVCPFVHPRSRVKLRSSARGQAGGSTDIMNFYATTYGLAYGMGVPKGSPETGWGSLPRLSPLCPPGQPCFHPRLGHHTGAGFVSNYRSDVPSLLRSCGTAEWYVPPHRGGGQVLEPLCHSCVGLVTARTASRPPPSTSSPTGTPTVAASCRGTCTSHRAGTTKSVPPVASVLGG